MKKNEATPIEFDVAEILAHISGPEDLNFYLMREQRRIWIDFSVDGSIIEFVRMIHLWNIEDKGIPVEQRKPIWIMLENYGGDSDYMWMMVDTIETSTTPVYTVNLGVAASAASIIFIAGKKRYMMPNANVIIHEGSAQLGGDAVKVLDASDSYRKELKRMKEFILSKTNIPPATLNKKKNNDWSLDSTYCLEHGVCDEVVTSIDQIL